MTRLETITPWKVMQTFEEFLREARVRHPDAGGVLRRVSGELDELPFLSHADSVGILADLIMEQFGGSADDWITGITRSFAEHLAAKWLLKLHASR